MSRAQTSVSLLGSIHLDESASPASYLVWPGEVSGLLLWWGWYGSQRKGKNTDVRASTGSTRGSHRSVKRLGRQCATCTVPGTDDGASGGMAANTGCSGHADQDLIGAPPTSRKRPKSSLENHGRGLESGAPDSSAQPSPSPPRGKKRPTLLKPEHKTAIRDFVVGLRLVRAATAPSLHTRSASFRSRHGRTEWSSSQPL